MTLPVIEQGLGAKYVFGLCHAASVEFILREVHMNATTVQVHEKIRIRWMFWAGWILSLWPAFVIISSATWKLTRNPWYVHEFARIGWPESALTGLAFLQLSFLALFLI